MADMKEDPQPKSQARKGGTRSRSTGGGRKRNLTDTIAVPLTMLGTGWAAADNQCGGAFLASVPELADALNTLAQNDSKVYKFFDGFVKAGGWGGVMLALVPTGMAVAEHHVMPLLDRSGEVWDEAPGGSQPPPRDTVPDVPRLRNPNELVEEG